MGYPSIIRTAFISGVLALSACSGSENTYYSCGDEKDAPFTARLTGDVKLDDLKKNPAQETVMTFTFTNNANGETTTRDIPYEGLQQVQMIANITQAACKTGKPAL